MSTFKPTAHMRSNYEPWEVWELDFLIETYPSKAWSALQIAQKLDRSITGLHQKAWVLGIRRPVRTFAHRHNPAFIADLKTRERISTITAKWGCTKTEVDRGRARLKGAHCPHDKSGNKKQEVPAHAHANA